MSTWSIEQIESGSEPGSASPPAPTTDGPRPGRESAPSGRANRVAVAVLVALALAFAVAVQNGAGLGSESEEGGSRLGGDFPAFYAAGAIVLSGDMDSLYDSDRQRAEQSELGVDGYLAFAYPPHVAAAYAPLAALDFRTAYALHTVLMVLALVVAMALLRKPVPFIARYWLPVLASTLAFYPLFRAVGGGQNTALTVLLFAVVWRALADDNEILAGVAAGLLLFRPQYAIPLICLFVLGRRIRAAVAAAVVALTTWAGTATFLGDDWLVRWFDRVVPFVERDAEVNAHNSISALGFLQALLGRDNEVAIALGLAGSVVVAGLLAWCWRAHEDFSIGHRMGVTAVGVLLLSPHTMFYDAGLLVIAAASLMVGVGGPEPRLVEGVPAKTLMALIGALWVAVLVHPLVSSFSPATPLFLVVAAVFAAMAHTMVNHRAELVGVR